MTTHPLPEVYIGPDGTSPLGSKSPLKSPSMWNKPSRWGKWMPSVKESSKDKPPKTPVKARGGPGPAETSTLPRYMYFNFSLTGENLLLWKKDSQEIVRIEVQTSGGRVLDLARLLPGAADESVGPPAVNVRFAAEGNEWIVAVLTQHRRLALLMFHSSGLAEHSSLHQLEDQPGQQAEPRCLAISPNNAYVAVGLGYTVLLLHYQGAVLQWSVPLRVPALLPSTNVRFQACSFSADSNNLVVATQRRDPLRGPDDDAVCTFVWDCELNPDPPVMMWDCKMPTVG